MQRGVGSFQRGVVVAPEQAGALPQSGGLLPAMPTRSRGRSHRMLANRRTAQFVSQQVHDTGHVTSTRAERPSKERTVERTFRLLLPPSRRRHSKEAAALAMPRFLILDSRAPRKIAPTGRSPQNCPRMIRLCSRSDSRTFTPEGSAIGAEINFSRCPTEFPAFLS